MGRINKNLVFSGSSELINRETYDMDVFSITQNGKPLDESWYTIDYKNKVISIKEHSLVLDFNCCNDWVFETGSKCTFKTGHGCTFKTGWNCTFNTMDECIFITGQTCTFNTGHGCTFNTQNDCTFNTGDYCTFETGSYGTFRTGYSCTFKTSYHCMFNTHSYCTFDTGNGCTFSLWDINSCMFKFDNYGNSIILDRKDNEAYKLTKEFVALQKIKNG